MSGPERPPAAKRRRPPPGRISPEALATRRGGAVEGLAWLGRPPEAKASLTYRSLRLVGRFALFGLFRFKIRTSGREHLPTGGYFLVAAAHRGWMDPFVVVHALPTDRARGSSVAHRRHSPRGGESDSSTVSVACSRSGAAASGSISTSRRRRPSSPTGPSSPRCPRGPSSGPPGRIGPFRAGWAVIALRTDPPIVPLAIAGTEELYLGRRLASQILPATTVRSLAGLPDGAALPAEGSREELDLAGRMGDALADDRRTGRRGALPVDDRSAGASAPAQESVDVAAVASRPSSIARPERRRALSTSVGARHGILAAMHYAESILDLVGDTPLVRITRLTRDLGPSDSQPLLLAKLEMLNPGGSVKDRIGLPMIEAAEKAGFLKPGGTDHRTDIGQHRSRPCHRCGAQGLSLHLRDGRQAIGREAAAPPGVRRGGRAVPHQRRPGLA